MHGQNHIKYGLQVGCFNKRNNNNNNNNNNNKTTAKTAILDRHLGISGDKGRTNVHGKTNCQLRYAHGNHRC